MAYANTVTVVKRGGEVEITITETGATTTDEPDAIDFGYTKGRILMQKCHLTAGSGATVDPILGKVTDPGAVANVKDVIVQNDTPSADIANQMASPGVTFRGVVDGKLYHRSVVNTGSDNAITTEYHILVGWK